MFTNLFALQEKPVLLLRQWLRLLSVQVIDTSINNTLQNHPDYPGLLSMIDALRTWQVNSECNSQTAHSQ